MRLFACDDAAPLWLEPTNEAHLSFRSAHIVPRQPEAVRSAHIRLAHVQRHLISRKYIAASWFVVCLLATSFIERINYQLAIDQNRLLAFLVVEHDPTTEATLRLLAGLRHHCIGPCAND